MTCVFAGFFDLQSSRDWYREHCRASGVGVHVSLARRFIELQALLIAPIAPHWAESVWLEILHKDSTIQNALYPVVPELDPVLTAGYDYVKATSGSIFQAEAHQVKKMQKGKKAAFDPTKGKKLTIFVSDAFPAWQTRYREITQQQYESTGTVDSKAMMGQITKTDLKRAMPFIFDLKKRLETGEKPERVFESRLPFDEAQVLREMVPGLKSTVNRLELVDIVYVKEGEETGEVVFGGNVGQRIPLAETVAASAIPGKPAFAFTNV
jgi:leucyl-tRNA synthetase